MLINQRLTRIKKPGPLVTSDQCVYMVQVVNLHTNKVARIIGKVENTERFLRIALYQGGYSTKKVKKLPAAAANVNEQREPLTDPTLLCCAFKKHRIYLFRCISTIILLVVHAVPVLVLITFFFLHIYIRFSV